MNEPKLRFKADDGSQFPDWEEKTIDEYLEEMRRIIDHYDFDTLHEKIAVWNP